MNPARATALLNGKVEAFSIGLGGERQTDHDMALTLGLIWNEGARLYGRVKWAGQDRHARKLLAVVINSAEQIRIEQNWTNIRHGELERVCRLALSESINPKLCPKCKGLGFYHPEVRRRGRPRKGEKPQLKVDCEPCQKEGVIPMNDYTRAMVAGISRYRWAAVWDSRYYDYILPIVTKYGYVYWSAVNRLHGNNLT